MWLLYFCLFIVTYLTTLGPASGEWRQSCDNSVQYLNTPSMIKLELDDIALRSKREGLE